MKKKLVEEFCKETRKHEIRLIAGIDPTPPYPTPNAIFYVRMESTDKEQNETCKVEPIWLSRDEMMRLSVLMILGLRFWEERLEKGSSYSRERISEFIDAWHQMRDSMNDLL